jgi:hypothetical protein
VADLFASVATNAARDAGAGSTLGPWGTAIGAGLGALGGLFSWFGSQDQAARMRAQAAEELRRKKLADEQRLGAATAAAAASGVEFESPSMQIYLRAMKEEMARQQEYQRSAGAANAGAVGAAGDIGLFTNFGSTLFNLGRANSWWLGTEADTSL